MASYDDGVSDTPPDLARLRSSIDNIDAALDRYEARLAALAARGIALDRLTFAADFGRRLDYYTGFVFEMFAGRKASRPVVGGGRYDRLVSLLARLRHETAVTVPAVGFSIWLDRVGDPA